MNETFNFPTLLSEDNIGLVIKVFQAVILTFFIVYSILTIRQVDIMNHALRNAIRFELKVFAYLQLFLGIGILILVLIR